MGEGGSNRLVSGPFSFTIDQANNHFLAGRSMHDTDRQEPGKLPPRLTELLFADYLWPEGWVVPPLVEFLPQGKPRSKSRQPIDMAPGGEEG